MTFRRMKTDCRAGSLLVAALMLLAGCLSSRANVYATDIKLNGSTNNAAIVASSGLQISYILNEPATAGVTVQIESSSAVLWTTNLAWQMAGTAEGSNSVAWDGTDQTTGASAAAGIYSISITAGAVGYDNWTNITDDGTNFSVEAPMSIAVNKNANSPFCGRVFVGCAPSPDVPGVVFNPGIAKFNADGSAPDEGGGVCKGGYQWAGLPYFSPWKISISSDDKVYIDDWSAGGIVLAFDEVISTNYMTVLGTNNYSYPDEKLSGPLVTGAGTNTLLLMADANTNTANGGSLGIVEWAVTNNGLVGSNDTGTVLVGISSNTNGLTVAPWDMSLDTNGNIYAIQNLDGVTDPGYAGTMRVFCFPAYEGVTETNAIWSIGSTDEDLEKAFGIAVDPSATFVAVAVFGYGTSPESLSNGGVNIYYATNGQLVTQLDTTNGLDYSPEYTDVAWDNAGNLYATDYGNSVWRAYSPPGPNQATTVAVPVVEVYDALAQPLLCAPQAGMGEFGFTLLGQSNVAYVIESSPDLITWTKIATNYETAAVRAISLPMAAGPAFYQAVIP
jgi:hypothetical protein